MWSKIFNRDNKIRIQRKWENFKIYLIWLSEFAELLEKEFSESSEEIDDYQGKYDRAAWEKTVDISKESDGTKENVNGIDIREKVGGIDENYGPR